MTYRERRLARAERLQGWAEKREAKAEVLHAKAQAHVDMVPFGQPILLGHHSQRRAERDRDRFIRNMDNSIEHGKVADRMNEKAANILDAVDRSIYSDDPDAIEQLTARIAELEAKRTKINADNAAWRKANPGYRTMSWSEKRAQMPHADYELTNLSGNLPRQKKRLEQLTRRTKS